MKTNTNVHRCNNSRNLTMQSMLGNPPIQYQKIKSDVDDFILWSEVTADGGLQAGSVSTCSENFH